MCVQRTIHHHRYGAIEMRTLAALLPKYLEGGGAYADLHARPVPHCPDAKQALQELTLDTVRKFLKDSKDSNFKI